MFYNFTQLRPEFRGDILFFWFLETAVFSALKEAIDNPNSPLEVDPTLVRKVYLAQIREENNNKFLKSKLKSPEVHKIIQDANEFISLSKNGGNAISINEKAILESVGACREFKDFLQKISKQKVDGKAKSAKC